MNTFPRCCLRLPSLLAAAVVLLASPAGASTEIEAGPAGHAMAIDGRFDDWHAITGVTIALSGTGGAPEVELKAAVRVGRIFLYASWLDATADEMHKPYDWDEARQDYVKRSDVLEDRFAISFAMAGEFTPDKLDGSEFEADVWHWKASRSNPAGLAHDKSWKVSARPFENSREFPTPGGGTVHLARPSDAGDRLYKPARYDFREDERMPSYTVNSAAGGSVADVTARGVWADGRWQLEMSRALDTGHDDDAVLAGAGTIECAIALFDGVAFNAVDGGLHSVSGLIVLRTTAPSS